jgi:hypothetical protein
MLLFVFHSPDFVFALTTLLGSFTVYYKLLVLSPNSLLYFQHLNDESRMRSSLVAQLGSLDRAKRGYDKAFKEAERALDEYQRADADLNLSRAVVEKARMNMVIKTQQCEDAKTEYANQLQKTNELQVRITRD